MSDDACCLANQKCTEDVLCIGRQSQFRVNAENVFIGSVHTTPEDEQAIRRVLHVPRKHTDVAGCVHFMPTYGSVLSIG